MIIIIIIYINAFCATNVCFMFTMRDNTTVHIYIYICVCVCVCVWLCTYLVLQYIYKYIIFCGPATQRGSWPPHSWGFLITHNDARVISSSQRPLPDNTQRSQQTNMPPVGFEPTISGGERPQTYALDSAVTGTSAIYIYIYIYIYIWFRRKGKYFWV